MDPIGRIVSLAATAVLSLVVAQPRDDLDTFIQAQMVQRQINGLSLAIIQEGRIEARAYGASSRGGVPVTTATLFQAGRATRRRCAWTWCPTASRGTRAAATP